ncbi:MAG TPA: diguanylate cyclase [Solirubrobacterales bacterium]|jgi:diguanylate cyclase (GGDEF)-like protein|nr:diguanylate cyclase [Solirubrobacterales bacterium]
MERPSQTSERPLGNKPVAARQSSSDAVKAMMAEVGLVPEVGWIVTIALFGLGGIVCLLGNIFLNDLAGWGPRIIGIVCILFAAASVIGLRRKLASKAYTHLRIGFGISIQIVGAIVFGAPAQAFMLMPLFSTVAPAIYYTGAVPWMYTVLGSAYVGGILLFIDQPVTIGMALVTPVVIATICISLMLAGKRTRSIAAANRRMACTDALTGAANMRKLREELELLLNDQGDDGQFALFAMDLDNFKLVNDTFDHTVGDHVLKAVSAALQAEVGPRDLVTRRGGDEFAILVRDFNGRDLDELQSRLTAAIAEAREATCPEISPTGCVAYVRRRRNDTLPTILESADEALHIVKSDFHRRNGGSRNMSAASVIAEADSKAQLATDGETSPEPKRKPEKYGVANAMWQDAASMFMVFAGVISVLGVSGLGHPLSPSMGLLGGFAMFACAVACAIARAKRVSVSYLHVAFGGAIGALLAIALAAGSMGAALIDLYAVVTVFAYHLFVPRIATRYLPFCVGAFSLVAFTSSAPYAFARSAAFAMFMVITAATIAKLRSVTATFVQENWELSQRDSLTGVANVRALKVRVIEAVEKAQLEGETVALVSVDLDEFKEVNDTFSHTVGDQVLAATAHAISENVRLDDLVARRGGDEFVVLARGSTRDEVDAVAARVRSAIERARLRICPELRPSASVAVIEWETGDSAEEFLEKADSALHVAKLESRGDAADTVSSAISNC